MRTSFAVRDRAYEASVTRVGRPEGEMFEIFEVAVVGPGGSRVEGTLKFTEAALALAEETATKEGGTADEKTARGCARCLAAELAIRKLKPDFSFVVDHRWIP
jgi:hypothetical protein